MQRLHGRAANFVLGLTEAQMNKVHDYDGVKANQLRTLEHLGLFTNASKPPVELTEAGWILTAERVLRRGPFRISMRTVPSATSPRAAATQR
jgi:hypothetical protein